MILFVAALTATLAVELVLPSDATKHILELRGRWGSGEQLAARRDQRSSIREIALRNDRGELLTTAWIRRPIALRPDYRVVITYAGANTGEAILQLIPAKDDLIVVAVPGVVTGTRAQRPSISRDAGFRPVRDEAD